MTDLSIPVAQPPRSWELRTIGVLSAVAVTAVLNLVCLVWEAFIWHYFASGGTDSLAAWEISFDRNAGTIGLLLLVLALAYIVVFVQWSKATNAMLTSVGDRSGVVNTHWTITAWRVCIGLSIAINIVATTDAGDRQSVRAGIVYATVQSTTRLAGMLLLIIGVWQIRDEVRERVAQSGVALRFNQGSLHTASSLTADAGAEWEAGAGAAADEAYWASVGELAVAAGADVALLAATGPFAHRWLLVPASGDVTAVRAELEPGTRVTAFALPPSPGFDLPAGDGPFHGFLDGRYRSVSLGILAGFLGQATDAARWALYPKNDPTALRATTEA